MARLSVFSRLNLPSAWPLPQSISSNFFGPLQTIIPWASNAYTERLIEEARAALSASFRGFVMLGGMSAIGCEIVGDAGAQVDFCIGIRRRADGIHSECAASLISPTSLPSLQYRLMRAPA